MAGGEERQGPVCRSLGDVWPVRARRRDWFPDPVETARLLRLTAEAERRNRIDADRAAESNRRVHHDLRPTPDVACRRRCSAPRTPANVFPCGTSPIDPAEYVVAAGALMVRRQG
ncbi:hypothetical protein GCM10010254_47250 [Streptomyces chromofuscus]|nr:hypothetical protein GCM10010254_47250 [Streptomyces chromofuscus]